MRVLVAGSHGLVGTALAGQLRDDGHDVIALGRGGSGPGHATMPPAGRGEDGRTVRWTPTARAIDAEGLESAGPFDAVVNLAGAGIGDRRWTPRRRAELRASRVAATGLLAGVLRGMRTPPAVLVNASAVGFYGDRGDEVLDEDSPPGGGFLATLCKDWEAEAAAASDFLRVVRLRSGIVFSADGGALARQLPLFRLGLGGRLGDGRQWVSWISLRDEVTVIRRAIEDPRLSGALNAVSPAPVTNGELTAALGRALHRPAVLPVPGGVLGAALGRDVARELLLASQRVRPARLASIGHRFADADIDGALAAIVRPAR